MANNKNNKEMKGGFGYINIIWTSIVGLATIVGTVISIYMCSSSLPPTLTIYYNGKVVESGDSCNVVVCVDDTTIARPYEPLFPVISNTTSRTAREFALTYTMTVDSVEIMSKQSYFYQINETYNTFTLKYIETSMPPQTMTKDPLGVLKLKGNTGVLKFSAFATHDGVKKPYTFNSTAKFLYVDSKNLDSKQWKSACRHAITSMEDIPLPPDYIKTDVFYCSSVHGMTFEFDRQLSYTNEVPDMAIADTDSIAIINQSVEEVKVASLDAPVLSDTIGIISSSYKKNVWAGDSIEITIANGYENDTTLYVVLKFQNLSNDYVESKNLPVVLKPGENEFVFAIDNNQKFLDCTFISECQYVKITGSGDLSEKFLNNGIEPKAAKKIFPFLFFIIIACVVLFILSIIYKKRSRVVFNRPIFEEEDTDDDNNCSANSNNSNVTIYRVKNKEGDLEFVEGEEHEEVKEEVYETHGGSTPESHEP